MTFILVLIALFVIFFLCIVVMPVILTRVPYVPTSRKRFRTLFSYLERNTSFPDMTFVDVGCGYGNVLREASRRGCRRLIGIEASPFHALVAFVRTRFLPGSAHIFFGNVLNRPLPRADVYYLFLVPPVVPRVLHYIQQHAPQGSRILILGDTTSRGTPVEMIAPDGQQGVKIYCYTVS